MSTFLISFDDTDNLETLGTGHLLNRFLNSLPCETGYITRHQLFVNERVPFTSHNSAMCAPVSGAIELDELVDRAARFLEESRAEGSDPGLCIADVERTSSFDLLVEWGRRAKTEVLQKDEAYALAERCRVHLSEHGGDGQGIVGALAAVGLRLSGNDGRVRGKATLDAPQMTVRELVALSGFDRVCAYGQGILADDCVVITDGNEVKAVYQDFASTVLVTPVNGKYRLLEKQHLKRY